MKGINVKEFMKYMNEGNVVLSSKHINENNLKKFLKYRTEFGNYYTTKPNDESSLIVIILSSYKGSFYYEVLYYNSENTSEVSTFYITKISKKLFFKIFNDPWETISKLIILE